MSVRLTNAIRDGIVRRATETQNKLFIEEKKNLEQEEHDLAMKLYREALDVGALKLANKLGEKWVKFDRCLRFNCAGYDLYLRVKTPVPVPRSSDCSRLANFAGAIAIEGQNFANKKKDLDESNKRIRRAVEAMLYSCSTIKMLAQAWPEGKQFYEMYDGVSAKSAAGLPAIQVSEINKMLGLK